MGEVLLTTRMSKVFLRFRQSILPRNTPLAEFHPKGEMVQSRQAGGLGKGEPPPGVVAASQFDLHVALPLTRPQGKIGERLLVELKRDAHADSFALPEGGVNPLARGKARVVRAGAMKTRGGTRSAEINRPGWACALGNAKGGSSEL